MSDVSSGTPRTVVAMIGNPVSDKGRGAKIDAQVMALLDDAGRRHGFDIIDLTGTSFDDSLRNARDHRDDYSHLVVVGGDGMIALGANAVGSSGKPLGIVATGSGNDFARGLGLPVNRIATAVEGIVGAIVRGSHIDVDMGRVTSLPGGYAVDAATGNLLTCGADAVDDDDVTMPTAAHGRRGDVSNRSGTMSPDMGRVGVDDDDEADGTVRPPIDRYYGGMLNCGLDASINDRANHSHLPGGSLRYFAAVLVEVAHLKQYGYHIKAVLADGSVEERDIISPMITVANSRHIGGGLEVSPYSRFADGLLDLVWIDHMPNVLEIADAISKGYNGRLLASHVFGWKRVREVEITRAAEGDEPPVLMADGEYIGHLPVKVTAQDRALRVLVPPAVARDHELDDGSRTLAAIERDGRDPVTGEFLRA
ncbi:DeoR family transcriptional regulator [Bifidobacterium ramosum]|uniref:DeoR family transcriptional regulator n=1 Tax=Bifidobacterium ramosum TaxID=1798158 RepID=A0A6L4X0E8_9BIFI|nr:diacylglycerol kinase family protein [Bifidobacterium ramosum]KAB8286938.1 DeoR family transcriptional regulator [Bifidobacterium ramosum]NEG72540.1 diacylglycerol kinase [Bifidobacterium ramosum]